MGKTSKTKLTQRGDTFLETLKLYNKETIIAVIENGSMFSSEEEYRSSLLDMAREQNYDILASMLRSWKHYIHLMIATDPIDAWTNFKEVLDIYPKCLRALLQQRDIIFSIDIVDYIMETDSISVKEKMQACRKMQRVLENDKYERNRKTLENLFINTVEIGDIELAVALCVTFSKELDFDYIYNFASKCTLEKCRIPIMMLLASLDKLRLEDLVILRRFIEDEVTNAQTFLFQLDYLIDKNYDIYYAYFMDSLEKGFASKVIAMLENGFCLYRTDIVNTVLRAFEKCTEADAEDDDTANDRYAIRTHLLSSYNVTVQNNDGDLNLRVFPKTCRPTHIMGEVYAAALALALKDGHLNKAKKLISDMPYGTHVEESVVEPVAEVIIYTAVMVAAQEVLDYLRTLLPRWSKEKFNQIIDNACDVRKLVKDYEKELANQ